MAAVKAAVDAARRSADAHSQPAKAGLRALFL